MIDMLLEYRGRGAFQTRTKQSFEAAERAFSPQEPVKAKIGKNRSRKQNDYFHGLCHAAFTNQRGGPALPSWRHLKSHLLIEAGHCDEVRVSLYGVRGEAVAGIIGPIAAALRRQCETIETSYDKRSHEMVMRFAKSWKFEKAEAQTATEVFDRVIAYVCTEIVPGVDPKTIMEMAKSSCFEAA